MEQQKYEPCNSKYMKTYLRENCGLNPFTREKLPPTCQLKDYPHMIDNITTFLCHIIPNNNNNDIQLSDIKTGEIMNRGSFGYTFGLKDKNFIIKIIVCLPNLENMTKLLKNEIEIHSLLSKYDTINYIQLYGYYIKNDDNIYYYYDIINNIDTQINFGERIKSFETNCETYLIMHKGLNDVASYIGRIFDDNTYTTFITDIQDIYDLLNAFKVSNLILENEGKIFIHSDIKAENIVRAYDNTLQKYNLKLIDFGLSKLSETFFINSSDGTELIFKILFTHQISDSNGKRDIYNDRLSMVSPLFDIFSIILVMFELFIKHRMNTLEYNIYKINEIIIEYTFELKEKNNILYQNIRRLLNIFNSIYDFHQIRIKKYYEDVMESESLVGWIKGFVSKNPLQKYIDSYDMIDFKLSDIGDIVQPKYIVKGNKLKDDMDYLTNLISFSMELQFD
jgi:hypothetical protein